MREFRREFFLIIRFKGILDLDTLNYFLTSLVCLHGPWVPSHVSSYPSCLMSHGIAVEEPQEKNSPIHPADW